ncbi:MAG: pseudouridine synthase [Bacteroidota bacterium]
MTEKSYSRDKNSGKTGRPRSPEKSRGNGQPPSGKRTERSGEKRTFSKPDGKAPYRRKPAGKESSAGEKKENSRPAAQGKADVRLNKLIANTGICSRREADELIAAGLISVNGKVITEMGFKVNPSDEVRYNGERLQSEKKVYLLLNKPKDFVTSVDDPHASRTVMDLVKNACKERIYPVGRLDRNTTGVLLFTNDGELTKQLTHPSYNKKKIYHVLLDKPITKNEMVKITDGIMLEDGLIQADAVAYASKENKREVGIELHSGKNRVVRRIFETLGFKVQKLDRVYFAGLTKKDLPRGRWRFLTEQEIKMLKMKTYE